MQPDASNPGTPPAAPAGHPACDPQSCGSRAPVSAPRHGCSRGGDRAGARAHSCPSQRRRRRQRRRQRQPTHLTCRSSLACRRCCWCHEDCVGACRGAQDTGFSRLGRSATRGGLGSARSPAPSCLPALATPAPLAAAAAARPRARWPGQRAAERFAARPGTAAWWRSSSIVASARREPVMWSEGVVHLPVPPAACLGAPESLRYGPLNTSFAV